MFLKKITATVAAFTISILGAVSANASTMTLDVAYQGYIGKLDCTNCYWLDVYNANGDGGAGASGDYNAANWDGDEVFHKNYGTTGPQQVFSGSGTDYFDLALYRFDPDNSGLQNEIDHLAVMLGDAGLDVIQEDQGPKTDGPYDMADYEQPDASSITNLAMGGGECIILKFGDGQTGGFDHGVVCFDTDGVLNYSGSALSHYTRGSPPEVPLPASGLLLVAGFGAFAALRRRKQV